MVHLLEKLLANNQSPLYIPTFDGSNSPYHPSVLYFPTPWNGYSYWMANTPYPHKTNPYRDRYECPSVFASNDGFHWVTTGNNPIVNLTAKEIEDYDYYSDPHLTIREGALECWYRLTKRNGKHNYSTDSKHYLLRKRSNDGVNWDKGEIVMDLSKMYGREMVSPALLYQNCYKMWMVDLKVANGSYTINYQTSTDGKDWSEIEVCNFKGKEIHPWHIDVQFFDNHYWLTCYEKFKGLTLWKSSDGKNFEFACELLNPSHSTASFYGRMLYRASIIKISDNDYRLYFSAEDDFSAHIGVMRGTSPTTMQVVSVDGKTYRNIHNMKDLFMLYLRGLKSAFMFKVRIRLSQI